MYKYWKLCNHIWNGTVILIKPQHKFKWYNYWSSSFGKQYNLFYLINSLKFIIMKKCQKKKKKKKTLTVNFNNNSFTFKLTQRINLVMLRNITLKKHTIILTTRNSTNKFNIKGKKWMWRFDKSFPFKKQRGKNEKEGLYFFYVFSQWNKSLTKLVKDILQMLIKNYKY